MNFNLKPIGYIETPYNELEQCPRNIDIEGPLCKLIINEEYQEGLKGLITGQQIMILYWFDNKKPFECLQRSKKTGVLSGVFSLRSPNRPNPIGAATLEIQSIIKNTLLVKGLDCLNRTPLLDIKPMMKIESSS